MILIGEKLNSSIPKTLEAMEKNDENFIIQLIKKQAPEATYLDVNTAMCQNEKEKMNWIVGLILKYSNCGIMIDTTNDSVMEQAAQNVGGRNLILNSLTLTQRFSDVSRIALQNHCSIIALPIDDNGIPENVECRVDNIKKLIDKCTAAGIAEDAIFIDVLAQALATGDQSGKVMLDTISKIRSFNQNVHLTCGLSNISFGLPNRKIINRAMFLSAVSLGLDSAICDTSDQDFILDTYISRMILGQDDYCMDYISKAKEFK